MSEVDDKAEIARQREEAKSLWEESNILTEEERTAFTDAWLLRRGEYVELFEQHSINMLALHDANTIVSERLTYGYSIDVEAKSLANVERLARLDLEVNLLATALGEPRESSVIQTYHKHLLEERLVHLRGKK